MIPPEEKKETNENLEEYQNKRDNLGLKITTGSLPPSNNSGLVRQTTDEGAVFLSDESDSAGFECPVCLEVMWKPVQTPCNHLFCERCLYDVVRSVGMGKELACPLCRSELEGFDTKGALPLMRNEELEAMIKKKKPEEFKKRRKAAAAQKKEEEKNIRLELSFGNTHQLLKTKKRSKHLCTMYLKAVNEDIDLSKLIRSIKLHLWSNTRILRGPLFQCNIKCWGTFDIRFEVFWQRGMNLETANYEHELCFDLPDCSSISWLTVPRKTLQSLGALKKPEKLVRRVRRRKKRSVRKWS